VGALRQERASAEDVAAAALARRQELEKARARWFPGQRRQLESARRDERLARTKVEALRQREDAVTPAAGAVLPRR
jgi:hypothetical protein